MSLESNSLKKEDNSFQAYFGPIYSKDGKSMQYLVCVDQDIAEGSSDANSCFNPFLDNLGNPFIFDENQIKMIAELKDNYNSGTLTINTINNEIINKKNNWTWQDWLLSSTIIGSAVLALVSSFLAKDSTKPYKFAVAATAFGLAAGILSTYASNKDTNKREAFHKSLGFDPSHSITYDDLYFQRTTNSISIVDFQKIADNDNFDIILDTKSLISGIEFKKDDRQIIHTSQDQDTFSYTDDPNKLIFEDVLAHQSFFNDIISLY